MLKHLLNSRPTVLDLFSGCGGMSLGMEAAGFDVVCSVEFDPVHSLVHHFNFPYGATICKDISMVTATEIYAKIREKGYECIDVIVGGPPCQGFSQIGKRQLDDSRNRLVFEYVRLIKEIKPKYFVFENVPGIASGEHKKFLTELLEQFDKIGYSIDLPYKVLNASHYGVAQTRRRLILIGTHEGHIKVRYPKPTHTKHHRECDFFENEIEIIKGSSDAISDFDSVPIFIGDDLGLKISLNYNDYSKSFSLNPRGSFEKCHKRVHDRKVFNHVGSNHSELTIKKFLNATHGKNEPTSRFFKLHPNMPCNTIRAGTNSDHGAHTAPRPIHYSHPRCISVREGARLHSFPDWFQFHRTIWHGFREIGNAVTPFLGKAIGEELINSLGLTKMDFPTYTLDKQNKKILTFSMTEAAQFWGVDRNVIPVRRRF